MKRIFPDPFPDPRESAVESKGSYIAPTNALPPPPLPQSVASDYSDKQIQDWAERHDIQGSLTDKRCMFTDAASTKPEYVPVFEMAIKQVVAHLDQQGKTYIEIALDPKTKEIAWTFTATTPAMKAVIIDPDGYVVLQFESADDVSKFVTSLVGKIGDAFGMLRHSRRDPHVALKLSDLKGILTLPIL